MNFSGRLNKLLEDHGISSYKLAKDVGISQTTVKNYKQGSTKPNTLIMEHLAKYFGVNQKWLDIGEGDVSVKKKNNNRVNIAMLRYYNIDATEGVIGMFDIGSNTSYTEVGIPGFNDCDIALNVWGDSMEPVLKNGHIIICKEWKNNFIEYGYIYLIITIQNHRMIKYLRKSDNDTHIICESTNNLYQPFEIERDEIAKLYLIKGHVNRFAI